MAVSSQEHKSLLNRLERLEDFIKELTGEGQSETGSEPRIVSAIWNGSGELPVYSVMRFKVHTDNANVNRKAARIPELEFMDIDEDDKLAAVTLATAQPGDTIPVAIDGIVLPIVKSRSSLSDLNDDPNKVIQIGDPLFIYNDSADIQGASAERGKLAMKAEDDTDSLNQFLGSNPLAFALDTQEANAQRVRSLLRHQLKTKLIFFDASVPIDSTQPDTNLNVDNTLTFSDDFVEAVRHNVIQLFLKAETSFNRIRALVIPLTAGPSQTALFGSVAGVGTFTAESILRFSLIRLDMAVGSGTDAALDVVTWNNAHSNITGFATDTTLYATASNIELFTSGDALYGQLFGILNPTAFENYQIQHVTRYLVFYFDISANLTKANNGLFFGMHIFWKTANQGGAPQAANGSAGILSATVRALTNTTPNLPRPFIVVDTFDVMSDA